MSRPVEGRSTDPVIHTELAAKSTDYLKVVDHVRKVALHWEKKGFCAKTFCAELSPYLQFQEQQCGI